jgi:hypothetical protein
MDEATALLVIAEGVARAVMSFSTPFYDPLLSLSIGATGPARSIAGLGRTSGAFRTKLHRVADSLGARVDDLALVISFETAGTFSPTEQNPISGALGLLQFMPKTLDTLGTSKEQAASMSAVDQLDLVERYLAPWRGKLRTLSAVYMAVLWPRLVGADERSVLFAEGSKEYAQNKGLDVDHDGRVQMSEATARVRSMRHGAARVLLLGDSIAEGLETPLRRAAMSDGAELVIATHKRGSTIHSWVEHARTAVDVCAPSLTVVALGSNDAAARLAPRSEDVHTIVKACRAWGGEAHWLTPFRDSEPSEALSGLVWQAGGVVLDGPALVKRARLSTVDGVHLDPNGYATAAANIWADVGGSAAEERPASRPQRPGPTPSDDDPPRRKGKGFALAVGVLSVLPTIMRGRG